MAQPTNPVNEAHKSYKQGQNTFPGLSYEHYTTGAYADANPFFVMETVEGDSIPLDVRQEIRTHTLKAPLMSRVNMVKSYYHIPMRAILPNSWELIYANPTQGDDVPDDANCYVDAYNLLVAALYPFYPTARNYLSTALTTATAAGLCKGILFAENVVSEGSLLARLGYRLGKYFKYYRLHGKTDEGTEWVDERYVDGFDQWLDSEFAPWILSLAPVMEIDGVTYAIRDFDGALNPAPAVAPTCWVSVHRFMELMRMNPDFKFTSIVEGIVPTDTLFDNSLKVDVSDVSLLLVGDDAEKMTINLARVLAYQLVCAHYYTDDRIDFVYSADLWRQTMYGIIRELLNVTGTAMSNLDKAPMFEYNGKYIPYDTFSYKYLNDYMLGRAANLGTQAIRLTEPTEDNLVMINGYYGFWNNILRIQKNLRFGDYFTGSRPNPLAVGDVNTAVVSEKVSTLDLTKNLLMQRFLNHVNRVGRRFSDYVRSLSGRTPDTPVTDPEFLASTTQNVSGFEVENTAENQGNIVTLLKSTGGEFAFNFEASEPGLVLGIFTFDAKRIYSATFDRFGLKKSRFDMFNKFMQYQGDQQIYRLERQAGAAIYGVDEPFSYTGRHMEYKQRVSIATAGFVKHLPGYAFITDNENSGISDSEEMRINPEYIRSTNAEFDRFYQTLSNISLSGYMHFIIRFDINCPAKRMMDFDPSIL